MDSWLLRINGVKKQVISQDDFVNFVNGANTSIIWDGFNIKVNSLITPGTGGVGTVTSVGAGNGMDFTSIVATGDVTMGTPSTCTDDTINQATGTTHTHAITGLVPTPAALT